jgi:hypothetical protein
MTARALTPPQVAAQYGIHADKVLAWIRTGELRAVNVAIRPNGKRARWRIDPADLALFEAGRTRQPTPKIRRRKKLADVIEFF